MTTPRKRPESAKPTRAREARPKRPARKSDAGARILSGLNDALAYAKGDKSCATVVTVTRTVGAAVESYTGTVADLRRLGVVPAAKGAK